MSGSYVLPAPRARTRRRRLWKWVGVACVLAVVIEVGAVTNGFGIPALLQPKGGSSNGPGPPGPNPNPEDEVVAAVLAHVTGRTNVSLPALQGTQLCNLCPVAPKENASFDPPVAGLWFYVNVTNVGASDVNLGNFTISTNGSNPRLFDLFGVLCCYPQYAEAIVSVAPIAPGHTVSLGVYVIASSIPSDGPAGYTLYFNSTSP